MYQLSHLSENEQSVNVVFGNGETSMRELIAGESGCGLRKSQLKGK